MLAWLGQSARHKQTAREFYGSIVTQARRETFFAEWGVPDTVAGRFEAVALHVAIALDRLGHAGGDGQRLRQALAEAFIVDMDDCMREIGLGDLAVPGKVKRAAAALYDRYRDYGSALAGGNVADVAAAVSQNFGKLAGADQLEILELTGYIGRLHAHLAGVEDSFLARGQVRFPTP